MDQELIDAAYRAIELVDNMSDDELIKALEECDGAIAYAFEGTNTPFPHLNK